MTTSTENSFLRKFTEAIESIHKAQGQLADANSELSWSATTQLIATTTQGDRRIALVLSPLPMSRKWAVTAIETPASFDDAQGVLDEHAHKIVGTYPSLRKSIEAADSFVESWRKGRQATSFEPCACDEIPPPK